MTIKNKSLKATRQIATRFDTEPLQMKETKLCLNRQGHMTNMATTLIYGRNL